MLITTCPIFISLSNSLAVFPPFIASSKVIAISIIVSPSRDVSFSFSSFDFHALLFNRMSASLIIDWRPCSANQPCTAPLTLASRSMAYVSSVHLICSLSSFAPSLSTRLSSTALFPSIMPTSCNL